MGNATQSLAAERLEVGKPKETIATVSFVALVLYASPFIAVGPSSLLSFGYTLPDVSGKIAIADSKLVDQEPTLVNAPGNYDAVALSDDELLLNGNGLGELAGQALYLYTVSTKASVVVGTNIGQYSGAATAHGDWVLAGGFASAPNAWPDASEGHKVFALKKADVLAAADTETPIDVFVTGALFAGPSQIEFTPDGRLLSVATDFGTGKTSITVLTVGPSSTGGLEVVQSNEIANGAVFTSARAIPGTPSFLLQHAAGYAVLTP